MNHDLWIIRKIFDHCPLVSLQSPIDKKLYHPVDGDAVAALIDSAAPVAGHIEDDVGLYWLKSASTASAAVSALRSPTASSDPRVDTVFNNRINASSTL